MKNKKVIVFLTHLFVLSFLLDPNNILFHMKLPSFLLFLLWCFYKKVNFYRNGIILFSTVYLLLLLSTLNMLLNNYEYEIDSTMSFYTSQIVLFTLMFVSDKTVNLVNPCILAAKIISITTIFLTIIIKTYPGVALIFADSKLFMIMQRPILGHTFFSVFHLSSPIIVLSLGYEFAVFLSNKLKKYFINCFLYSTALYLSGTRANILSGFLVIMIIYLYYVLFLKKNMLKFVFIFVLICFLGSLMVFLLLTDETSGSSAIKYGHLVSISKLLKGNLNIFLFGNGPGSLYYSEGFHGVTYISELSYYELIRNYGLFSAIIICSIFFSPLLFFMQKKILSFSIFISYLAYLFIAGTNPLLMVPQGYVVLIFAYNVGVNNNKRLFII
jgi:hypothetical protein